VDAEKVKQLSLPPESKTTRRRGTFWIFFLIAVAASVTAFLAIPRKSDQQRLAGYDKGASGEQPAAQPIRAGDKALDAAAGSSAPVAQESSNSDALLTVSGYIVTRERIELSPRFMGVVRWIGVKKGDTVTNGQVVVLLDDSEYRARLAEIEARARSAGIAVERAELDYQRAKTLVTSNVEMQKAEDDARLQLAAARASLEEIAAGRKLIETYLDWTVIRSPIDGVVLEKLVDPNELVVPQSFGGPRGPSTALVAVANPRDLQVEIDLNEADLGKVQLNQPCRISPEAYPDKRYTGRVAEISPEANRQKGTLMIKVQVENPDGYLTPELSARVDFLKPAAR
jgi:RND family efflux transporter MFP subunit